MTKSGKPVQIAPSLMCADFLNLDYEISLFEKHQVSLLHIDIMDGHYVPNFTLGPDFCAKISERSSIPLDIHLMIENVDTYIPIFTTSGSPIICFHPETSYHPLRTIDLIRSRDGRPGIAIDPGMSIEQFKYLLPEVEVICIMTVNPGYSGQKLITSALGKVAELRAYLDTYNLSALIEVDGNVSWENIPPMLAAGADILVAGTSSLFSKVGSREDNFTKIERLIEDFSQHADSAIMHHA